MWGLVHREDWALKTWCFQIVVLDKTLEIPLMARGSKQSILKEINLGYSLEGLMLNLNLHCFGHLMWRADSLEMILMLGKIDGKRRRGWQSMRWLDSIHHRLNGHEFEQPPGDNDEEQGSLVWGSPWGHRVRHDLVTEQQQNKIFF